MMRKNNLTAIIIIGVFLMLLSAETRAFAEQSAGSFEFSLSGRKSKLTLPVTIIYCVTFPDEGTIGVVLKDADHRIFTFSLDGRGSKPPMPKYKNIYLGAAYPVICDDINVKPEVIPIGGCVEKRLLTVLKKAKCDKPTDKYQDARKDVIDTVIKTLEARSNCKK